MLLFNCCRILVKKGHKKYSTENGGHQKTTNFESMTSDDELELEGDKKSFEKKLDYELMIEKTMAS